MMHRATRPFLLGGGGSRRRGPRVAAAGRGGPQPMRFAAAVFSAITPTIS